MDIASIMGAGASGPWGLLGGALGGVLGGAFGRGKRTGFGKAFNRSQFFLDANARLATERAETYGPNLFRSLAGLNPLFGAMQQRALGDLNDEQRTSRLTEAFQMNLGQQQAARGTFRSPSSALQTSFAGLQFMEQQRDKSLANALNVYSAANPLLSATLGAMGLNQAPMNDIGFQQLAANMNAGRARTQSMFNLAGEGMAFAQGALADNRMSPFRRALFNAYGTSGSPSGGTLTLTDGTTVEI